MVIILVQGWSSFSPSFSAVDFFSYYIELPIMAVMYLGWKVVKRTRVVGVENMDLETDVYEVRKEDQEEAENERTSKGRVERVLRWIF